MLRVREVLGDSCVSGCFSKPQDAALSDNTCSRPSRRACGFPSQPGIENPAPPETSAIGRKPISGAFGARQTSITHLLPCGNTICWGLLKQPDKQKATTSGWIWQRRSDVLSPRGSLVKEGELQWTGFNIAGLLCLVLMVLKLKLALLWSWWRVLLPLWVVLWQNAVHIAVGFLWLTWMGCGREGDDLRIRPHHGLDRYQLVSLVCALIFLDNVLRKMGGPGESDWWWMASGRTEVILLSAGAMLACQFRFWSGIVERSTHPRNGTE